MKWWAAVLLVVALLAAYYGAYLACVRPTGARIGGLDTTWAYHYHPAYLSMRPDDHLVMYTTMYYAFLPAHAMDKAIHPGKWEYTNREH